MIVSCWGDKLSTPFNFNVLPTGYSINGQFCAISETGSNPGCQSTRLVVDTPKNRMFIDLGSKYVMNVTHSFIWDLQGLPYCFKVSGFNFTSQVDAYKYAFSTNDLDNRYTGLVFDVGSCKTRISTSFKTIFGIIQEWSFAQIYPLGQTCKNIRGQMEYDFDTLEITKNRDKDFIVPASCNNPLDFCSFIYSEGNPCYS